MRVEGEEILSDLSEKTSRNLKAVAALVIAVKIFDVPMEDLQVLGIDLPAKLFSAVAFVLLIYLMLSLAIRIRVDYLNWQNGPIMFSPRETGIILRSVSSPSEFSVLDELARREDLTDDQMDQIKN